MRAKRMFNLMVVLLAILLPARALKAQGSIQISRYLGGNGEESGVGSVTTAGNTYLWCATTSTDMPVTNGSSFKGGVDLYVAKLNNNGEIVFASYFGGTDAESMQATLGAVVGDDFYLAFSTTSSDLPVTNGTVYSGTPGTSNLAVAKINALTGSTALCAYGGQFPNSFYGMKVSGGDLYIGAIVSLFDNPLSVTNGSSFHGGTIDIALARFSGTTGNKVWETYWGSTGSDIIYGMEVEGNTLHLAVHTNGNTPSMPSTNGTSNHGGLDIVYARLNAATATTNFLTYLGGSAGDEPMGIQVVNGEAYIVGGTYSANFPSTTGAAYKGNRDITITKFNASGSIVYSTIVGGAGTDGWLENSFAKRFDIDQGSLCFAFRTDGNNYPITNGSTGTAGDIAITKLNPSGNIVFSTYVGSPATDYSYDVKMQCDDVYLMGSFGPGLPTTNGTTSSSAYNTAIARFSSATGRMLFCSYVGATSLELSSFDLSVTGNGEVQAVTYVPSDALAAVTLSGNSYGGGPSDLAVVRINTSVAGHAGSTAVSPSIQTICTNGTTSLIRMDPCVVPGSVLPAIFIGGVPSVQADVPVQRYQWQVSNTPGGTWTNVPGATGKNFTPPTGSVTKYYRRLAFYTPACGSENLVQTGDVAEVIIGNNSAPLVNAGGPFVTCPGTPVTLGGSPTATANGGTTVIGYLWSPSGSYLPSNSSANPVVSPATSTIYTVTVTDNNGCEQTGQTLVNVYQANAGPAKSTCGGHVVRIGSAPIAGVPGVSYSWTSSPSDPTMSCTNCAQPDVHPSLTTTYTLTLSLPVTGGGNCNTTSSVTVNVVAAPVNNGGAFAGADVTVCSGGNALIGTAPESGFGYTWSPGTNLSSNNISRPLFLAGTVLPSTDPVRYYVTASKSGCTFVDSVEAFVLKPDAGPDGCGPRLIGTADATPNINETYSWTKLTTGAGTSTFLGATNLPQVPVSDAIVPTTFRLTVTFNGVSCSDDVVVGACGGCIAPAITINAPGGCPSYNSSAGQVTLTASSPLPVTFSWSPSAGLSSSTGASVSLTDNIPRTYTVTATSTIDPSFVCTNTIDVNNPGWIAPSFTAQQISVCPGTPVNIGQTPVAGYSYMWSGSGLNANNISDPVATVNASSRFPVTVTDNSTGCTATDTAIVTVSPMPQNVAGNDIGICGAGSVQLGAAPVAGVSYLWTPAAGYLPGNNVANPTVVVAATSTFHVDAVNADGCTASGDVTVTVNPPVSPFSFANQSYCPGITGAIDLPAGPAGMDKYSWSPSHLVINPDNNGPAATTLNTLPFTSTTYTLTVTNTSGCTARASVTFDPLTTAPDAGSNKVFCLKDGPLRLGSGGNQAGAGITYSWSPATGLDDPSDPNPLFTPATAGSTTYTLLKDEGGCTSQAAVTVTVNDYQLPALGSPTLCQNSCTQIGIPPAAGVNYLWSPGTGLSNPSVSNPIACASATTAYTLTGVDANGCSSTQTSMITVAAATGPLVSVTPLTACLGSAGNILTATVYPAGGAYAYEWSPGNGTLNNIYAQSPYVFIGGLGTRTYDVKVTDQTTGCNTLASATVNVITCSILPVIVESFTATAKEKKVLLSWKVSEEKNLLQYDVEYSTDARTFYRLGMVKAQNKAEYLFSHLHPVHGNNYYRLKMIESGSHELHYSEVRTVRFDEEQGSITIYPNPARDEVHLLLPIATVNKPGSIHVYDATGKTVILSKISLLQAAQRVNISGLTAGFYTVVLYTEQEAFKSRLIIQR